MMFNSKRLVFVLSLLNMMIPSLAAASDTRDPPVGSGAGDVSDQPLKEQTVYIPYDKLREIFEREGRGVFVPYEQFQELWQAARQAMKKPPDEAPPVEALISEVVSDMEVTGDVVRVRSRVRIDVLTEGWHEIPLRLGDAAISSASVAEQPARIIADGTTGHRLLVEKKGEQPEQVELALEYAKAFVKSPGRNSVSFEAPQAPVNRWRVRIPEAGVKVNIQPLIAATEVPAGDSGAEHPDETVVLAFVGPAPQVRIDWTPRAEGATGLTALVTVQADQRVWIREGVVRSRTNLAYAISRAAVDELVLEVPADGKVVNVFDANIRQWSVQEDGDVQRITMDLFEPARGSQDVMVELERFGGDRGSTAAEEIEVPVVQAVGAGRQEGVVAVAVAEGLRVEPIRRSGLLQIDAAEAFERPGGGRRAEPWALSYRYVTLPYELVLRVEKIEPRITVDALVEAFLEPQELSLYIQAVYHIQRAGVFRLELCVPAGFDVRHIEGFGASGVTPVKIESSSHVQAVGDRMHVVVNLAEKAIGRVGLAIRLYQRLDDPDLLSPTGRAAEVLIGIPRMGGDTADRATGRLVIYAPESIRLNPVMTEGLRSVPLNEAMEGMTSLAPASSRGASKGGSSTGAFSFVFGEEPAAVTLKAERRKPKITTRQLLAARIESGVVKYRATFFYDIRYSGVETLRIDIPTYLAGVIQNDTPGVSEAVIDPPPQDLPQDHVAWGLRSDKVFKGETSIRLSWETQTDPLEIGARAEIVMPRLVPMGVDRAWGQIVLAKSETIDIRAAVGEDSEMPAGLRPIDPRHDLMEGAEPSVAAGAARAFEFHDDWALTVIATRYKLEDVKRTSIERALIRTVVTRSDEVSVQALYRLRSARQRLMFSLPEGVAFDTDPVRINGRAVQLLESDQQDEYLVPLVDQSADIPFLLEIRYTVPRGGTRLGCPAFPSEPAVQKVYVGAYLPPDREFLGSIGPWTDELRWRFGGFLGLEPRARSLDSDLVRWVTDGVGVSGNPAETFQTDGRFYLFSALRPLPPPDGRLTLVTINEDFLSVLVFGIVLIGGVILLRSLDAIRLFAVGAFLAMLVLLGVFLPTFSRQIMDGVLLLAILTVVVMWLVKYFAWTRPRDPDVIAWKGVRQRGRMARMRGEAHGVTRVPEPEPPPSGELTDSGKRVDESRGPVDDQPSEPEQGKGGGQDA